MSTTTNSHSTICLPAHILDACITPRAREVLMLLASQTSAQAPTLWICQARVAERLRCSPITVARAIQKLIEQKLIADMGRLHEGRYKYYHVRWSLNDDMKAVSKKIPPCAKASGGKPKPIRTVVTSLTPKLPPKPIEGVQLILPPVAEIEAAPKVLSPLAKLPPIDRSPSVSFPSPVLTSTLTSTTIPPAVLSSDSRLAYFAEIARKRHLESRKLHQSILQSLN